MKKILVFITIVTSILLCSKLFAQLEGRNIYLYKNDKVDMIFSCTYEEINDWTFELYGEKRIIPYKNREQVKHMNASYTRLEDESGLGEVYRITIVKALDHGWNKETWYFYPKLNIVSPFSPRDIRETNKLYKMKQDPLKYGQKAILN